MLPYRDDNSIIYRLVPHLNSQAKIVTCPVLYIDDLTNSSPPSSSQRKFSPTPWAEIWGPTQNNLDREQGQCLPIISKSLADTVTSHTPSNNLTSASGPAEYAKVQIAFAVLSVYAASKLFSPTCPISVRNHFLVIRNGTDKSLHIWPWKSS